MSSALASCGSSFDWMKNGMGQGPCTVAAWLIALCQDASSNQPALVAPLASSSSGYKEPNGTSANACTCSWAFYNTIEACTVCQNFSAEEYPTWSSSCDVLGQSSTSTYWQSTISFSNRTKLPRWSILNPSKWAAGTFNADQAEQIANQNLPDVTDASTSQPSISPSSSASAAAGTKKTNVGAIAGGVIAGVIVLIALVLALWFFLFKRRGYGRSRGPRKHIDLDADSTGIIGSETVGNPLAAHLRSHSLSGSGYSTSPMSYHPPMQQATFQGYPITAQQTRSQSLPVTFIQNQNQNQGAGQTNVLQGILRTSREVIPTVAEQLDEKRRIRAERQNSGGPPRSRSAYAGTVMRTGSSGRLSGTNGSQDELNAGSNTAVISHVRSRSQSQISAAQGSNTSNTPSLRDNPTTDHRPSADVVINERASRRLSLKKAPWNRRRTVMNLGSDAGSVVSDAELSPPLNTAPLPLGGNIVAAAGQTTTASEVIAAVPGARLPTARDRENPPPGYTSANS